MSSCVILCLNDALMEVKDEFFDCLIGFLP